jgi:uncharacterized protein involved in exopolysaccharide biosynthesis
MSEGELSLIPAVAKLRKSWPLVVLVAILGGMVGWGASLVKPPEYESSAVLGIGIDFGRTHPLSKEAQRHALNRVRGLILSDDVLENMLAKISEQSNEMPAPDAVRDLRAFLRLEERESSWLLVVKSSSQSDASSWANNWAQSAIEQLDRSMPHALRAQQLQRELFEVGCELQPPSSSEEQVLWECSLSDGGDAEDLSQELLEEARLSHGIIPAMTYSVMQGAQPAETPSQAGRGAWIVIGLLLGIFAGTALVAFYKQIV